MKSVTVVACTLLAFAAPAFTQGTPPVGCDPDAGLSSDVARKIAIVIDSSGSNEDNDPDDLRIVAAKAFNDLLTSKSDAGAGGKPDQVTVVDFDSSATVIYPLGDPDGAVSVFDEIDASGGTDVSDGLDKALGELQKGGSTAKRSGIVILTDGESSASAIVEQLERAKDLGVRVILGFLQPPPPATPDNPDPSIVDALKATGGMYAGINSPAAQKAFINAVVAHGPTENDGRTGSTGNELFPGLQKVASLKTGDATFTYTALSGEKLNFTISAEVDVKYTLRTTSGSVLKSGDVLADEPTNFQWAAKSGVSVELIVEGAAADDELVRIELGSSIPRTDICKPVTNKTTTGYNKTEHPTPGSTGSPSTYVPTTGSGPYTKPTPTYAPYTGTASSVAARQVLVTVAVLSVGLIVFSML